MVNQYPINQAGENLTKLKNKGIFMHLLNYEQTSTVNQHHLRISSYINHGATLTIFSYSNLLNNKTCVKIQLHILINTRYQDNSQASTYQAYKKTHFRCFATHYPDTKQFLYFDIQCTQVNFLLLGEYLSTKTVINSISKKQIFTLCILLPHRFGIKLLK